MRFGASHKARLTGLPVALLAVSAPCIAQVAPPDPAPETLLGGPLVESSADNPIHFEPATFTLREQDIQVFGGTSPQRGDWSSIAITSTIVNGAAASCTATLVGRNAVLTAAHCVVIGDADVPAPIKIGELVFRCTVDPVYLRMGPSYSGVRHYADYALCATRPEDPRSQAFEQLRWDRIDLTPVMTGAKLLAAGFGCEAWIFTPGTNQISEGPRTLKLTVGDIIVDRADAEYFTSKSDGRTQPALCAGDSGGPAFSGISTRALSGARTIQGIASKNFASGGMVTSFFATLSTPRFRMFLECWLGAHPQIDVQLKLAAGDSVGRRQC